MSCRGGACLRPVVARPVVARPVVAPQAGKRRVVSEEQDQSPVPEQPRQVPGKAKSAKSKEAQEQALTARRSQSIWPFALAVALMVVLMGLITHPIVFGIGLLLAAAAIIGWGLERR